MASKSWRIRHGFSLIELLVVISIIILLAMIAKPNFMRFLAKAKRSEAYINLNSLYMAQKAHWLEHGTYSTSLLGPNGLGWKPEGYKGGGAQENFYYTYGFPGAEGQQCVTGKLLAPQSSLSQSHAGKDAFLIVAAGDIDGDGDLDILSIDHNKAIRIERDDLAN